MASSAPSFDLDAFRARLGLGALPEAPLPRLRALHGAMVRTVPFENLAILEGRPVRLDPDALADKILTRRRGGYCFELNGLLALALEALGYAVEHRLGRVWASPNPAPPPTHLVLAVEAEGRRWLCDVGFGGGGLREPLAWDLNGEAAQGPDRFRLRPGDHGETLLQAFRDGAWQDLYGLLPCAVRPQDTVPANHYTSTHPDSFFTQVPVAALATEEGRVTLRGRLLRHAGPDGVRERELASVEELVAVLDADFGLGNLDRPALAARLGGLFA